MDDPAPESTSLSPVEIFSFPLGPETRLLQKGFSARTDRFSDFTTVTRSLLVKVRFFILSHLKMKSLKMKSHLKVRFASRVTGLLYKVDKIMKEVDDSGSPPS